VRIGLLSNFPFTAAEEVVGAADAPLEPVPEPDAAPDVPPDAPWFDAPRFVPDAEFVAPVVVVSALPAAHPATSIDAEAATSTTERPVFMPS
jgi:hypothetical protein